MRFFSRTSQTTKQNPSYELGVPQSFLPHYGKSQTPAALPHSTMTRSDSDVAAAIAQIEPRIVKALILQYSEHSRVHFEKNPPAGKREPAQVLGDACDLAGKVLQEVETRRRRTAQGLAPLHDPAGDIARARERFEAERFRARERAVEQRRKEREFRRQARKAGLATGFTAGRACLDALQGASARAMRMMGVDGYDPL